MATASPETSDPLAVSGWRTEDAESKSERYVGRRLAEAGAEVKGVALTTFLLGSAVAGGLWLVAGVLAEHWIVPGGLPRGVRWGWLAVALAALLAAAIRWLLPLIRYRVNLVYAARAIEREHPELHNDVVNAVLAQARPGETTSTVLQSLHRRVAHQLSRVHNDGVVDFRPVLRLALALAVLVVAAVIYELVAPKSLLVSTVRLVAPWIGIAAPSRTHIDPPTLQWRQLGMPVVKSKSQEIPVVNRTATLVRGRQLLVTAVIRHLRRGESPLVIVTPRRESGAVASWRMPLLATKTPDSFEACLPDDDRGLDDSVDLVIAAGDAQTEPIRVNIVDAPTIHLEQVTYQYPKYTGKPDEVIENPGTLSAVEGTDVKIVARTNQPVDQAWVDFGADGKGDIPLEPGQRDLARVRGQFTLRLNADRNGAEHPTYRLMFRPKVAGSGTQSDYVDQLEYHIDVVPDLGPEASIVFPEQKVVRVRPDTAVTIRVRALDPDFGLASVIVETRLKDGPERPGRDLLAARGTKDRRTRFEGDEILVPERLGAGAGAVLMYRAVVMDNKTKANKTATEWQTLVIDATASPQPPPLPLQLGKSDADSGNDDEGGRTDDGASSGRDGLQPTSKERPRDRRTGRDGASSRRGAASADAGDESSAEDEQIAQPSSDASPSLQERKGGEQRPSGDSGEQDRQQPKSRQNDPKPAQDEGAPQQGEDQGSADGGKSQDGMKGKTGNQAGQRQQDGSSDGAGGQPEGRGGAGQAGDQAGQGREGTDGAPQKPGAGGQEKKPGGAARGSDAQDADQGGGRDQRGEGRRPGKNGGQAEQREEVASDGTADGDAMERILEHRRKVKPGDGGAQDPQTGSEPGTDAQANDRKPGERSGREGNKPAGAEDPTGPPSDGQARKQQPCNSPDGKPCGKPGCPSCGGGMSGGAAGGSATDGTSGSVADGGQPGSDGTKPSGTESGGGAPASAGGSADGERNRPEVADGGESGKASGSQGKNDGTGGAGGRDPASESTASDLGSGNESDRGSDGSDGGATPSDTAPSGSQAGGGERGEGSAANTTKPGGDEVAGDNGADEQNPGDTSGREGGGGAVGGGQRQQANAGTGERQDRPIEWTKQDLSHARNAADLALEHLRRSVDSGDRTVLDELGWTIEQAREFLARWERMREAAGGGDRRARSEFDEAVKSLGLRPAGARRTGDVPSDAKRGQAEGRRSRPPSDYREQFRAFLQGAAVE